VQARSLLTVLVGAALLTFLASCSSDISSATKVTEIARYESGPTQLTVTVEPTRHAEPDTLYLVVIFRKGEVRARISVVWTGAELDAGQAVRYQMIAKPDEIVSNRLGAEERKSKNLLGYFTVGSPSLVTLKTWWVILLVALTTILSTLVVWGTVHKELAKQKALEVVNEE